MLIPREVISAKKTKFVQSIRQIIIKDQAAVAMMKTKTLTQHVEFHPDRLDARMAQLMLHESNGRGWYTLDTKTEELLGFAVAQ